MGDLHMYINKSLSTLTSQWVDCRQVINVNNMKVMRELLMLDFDVVFLSWILILMLMLEESLAFGSSGSASATSTSSLQYNQQGH